MAKRFLKNRRIVEADKNENIRRVLECCQRMLWMDHCVSNTLHYEISICCSAAWSGISLNMRYLAWALSGHSRMLPVNFRSLCLVLQQLVLYRTLHPARLLHTKLLPTFRAAKFVFQACSSCMVGSLAFRLLETYCWRIIVALDTPSGPKRSAISTASGLLLRIQVPCFPCLRSLKQVPSSCTLVRQKF